MVQLIQQTVPKVFEFVSQEQIANFVQNNSVQWVRNTQVNKLASEMLRAVLENDFHQDVLQRGLDIAHEWVVQNPDKTRELTRKCLKRWASGLLQKVQAGSVLMFSSAPLIHWLKK